VLVPVILMRRVPASVMDIVDMIAMRHGHVTAALTVPMRMVGMARVTGALALVGVPVVRPVQVPVMGVIDVVTVRHRHVTTARTVRMIMPGVRVMLCHRSHRCPLGVVFPKRGVDEQCRSATDDP
jgi:hypothetical protein